MGDFTFFLPLSKVDAKERTVWGWASLEKPDLSNEVMDYASSKPHWIEWSEEAYKRSRGLSRGNLRLQHRADTAVGKLVHFETKDDEKGVWVGAKVVDDNAWKLVEEGVITSFSVGGKYLNRWREGQYTKYTAQPRELSIVDAGCLPDATFQMVKDDGSTELRKFAPASGNVRLVLDREDDMPNVVLNIPASALREGEPISISAQPAEVLVKAMPNLPSEAVMSIGAQNLKPEQPMANSDLSVNMIDNQKKVAPISSSGESTENILARHPPVVNMTPEAEKVLAQSEAQRTFTPPEAVRKEALRAIETGQLMPPLTKDIADGKPISLASIHRMVSYFAKHEGDKKAADWGKTDNPNYVAWLMSGGDEGQKWAEKIERKVGSDAVVKAVQDIPNLRHIAEGDLKMCSNCQFFRDTDKWPTGYCWKFDSKIQSDWVCDAWDKAGEHADAKPLAGQVGAASSSSTTSSTSTTTTPAVMQPMAQPAMEMQYAQKAAPTTGTATESETRRDVAKDVPAVTESVTKAEEPNLALDKAIAEAEALGKAVGIAQKNFEKSLPYDDEFEKRIPKKEGEPKSPPKGYPKDPKLYGDPANFSWPVDNPGRARSAMAYYNAGKGKDKYNDREWRILGRRLARLINQHGAKDGTVKFNPRNGKLEREEAEGKKMAKDLATARTLVTEVRGKLTDAKDGVTPEMVDQVASALDVVMSELSEATNEQGAVIGAQPPVVKADKPSTPESSTPTTETASTPAPKVAKAEDKPKPKEESMSDQTTPTTSDSTPTASVPTTAPVKKAEEMNKVEQPFATQPPVAYQPFNINYGVGRILPEFITALADRGDVRKAYELAGGGFDTLFARAQVQLLKEGGWTSENQLSGTGGLPAVNQRLIIDPDWGGMTGEGMNLRKAITSSSIPGVNLIRLVKLMQPVYAPLRQRFPTQPSATGSNQAIWRVKSGFGSFSFTDAMMSAENTTGAAGDDTFLTFTAPYERVTTSGSVTLEAIYTTRNYDDPMQVAIISRLGELLQSEDSKLLGDNSVALAAPTPAPVATAVAGSGFSAGTADTFKVSALSYIGSLIPAKGRVGSTNAVGETDGSSASNAINGTTTTSVTLTWTAVKGAVAYNVYWGLNGSNWYWTKTVTTTSTSISAAEAAAALNTNIPNTADTTANAYGYEGLIAWCEKSTIYSQSVTNKSFTDRGGAALTVSADGIDEIDAVLEDLWTKWAIAPSVMLSSPKSHKHFSNKLLSSNNPSLYRLEANVGAAGSIVGGAMVTGYHNKYASYSPGLPRIMDTIAHPRMTNGTYLFVTEGVPYPVSREARGMVVDVLFPYTYFPLAASTTINYPFAMLCSEALISYHPAAQAAIVGCSTS